MWTTDYRIWFNFHSFWMGMSLGLIAFGIQEKLYPVIALSFLGFAVTFSYISIILWMETCGFIGGKK